MVRYKAGMKSEFYSKNSLSLTLLINSNKLLTVSKQNQDVGQKSGGSLVKTLIPGSLLSRCANRSDHRPRGGGANSPRRTLPALTQDRGLLLGDRGRRGDKDLGWALGWCRNFFLTGLLQHVAV